MRSDDPDIKWVEEPKLGLAGRMYLPLIAGGLTTTAKHMVSSKVTVSYPDQEPEIANNDVAGPGVAQRGADRIADGDPTSANLDHGVFGRDRRLEGNAGDPALAGCEGRAGETVQQPTRGGEALAADAMHRELAQPKDHVGVGVADPRRRRRDVLHRPQPTFDNEVREEGVKEGVLPTSKSA